MSTRPVRGHLWLALLLSMCVPGLAFGQSHELVIPATTTDFLDDLIAGDTTASGDRLDPDRVYVLERDGIYLINSPIANDFPLRIVGQAGPGTRPVIYPVVNTATGTAPGNMINMAGDVWLQDLIMVGYVEGIENEINNVVASMIQVGAPGFDVVIDNVLMSQNRGQFIRTNSAARVIKVTNSTWVNSGNLVRTNLGAGKGVDLREASIDTLLMQNNTFVNFQDRIIRHLNSTGAIDNLIFDHNTIVNSMSYHGALSLGWTGRRIQITNNLWVDAFALGADPTDGIRQAEFNEHGEKYPNGSNRMAWIFNQPREGVTTAWDVTNNVYVVTPEGQAFFDQYAADGVLGEGPPLTWHINRQLDADSTTAFVKEALALGDTPALMTTMLHWYRRPKDQGGAGRTKDTDTYVHAEHDWDRRPWEYFDQTLDASYATTAAAYTGAEGGFPVGDLNWFPDRKAAWTATAVEHRPGDVPAAFVLDQSYPNPFNPTTTISYALPQPSAVTLTVHNVIGQEVARLLEARSQQPGRYDVTWDATDHAGQLLPTGVYFYRLQAGEVVRTGKMVFLK